MDSAAFFDIDENVGLARSRRFLWGVVLWLMQVIFTGTKIIANVCDNRLQLNPGSGMTVFVTGQRNFCWQYGFRKTWRIRKFFFGTLSPKVDLSHLRGWHPVFVRDKTGLNASPYFFAIFPYQVNLLLNCRHLSVF
ncbi:hypothetical protein TH25_24755 [Thalassospira profundimaris]|uniref:Uncharacterized protein n=1 Tax=Thalassospira profundimaris TaxID=502049 RepID=A0A367WJ64_9PROT|nr:hypothetical protein [Thalassospira profundimaris]RCK40522.1 hypothetical protein TH25_24755 [Thalassospira profundimaris]